MKQNGSKLSKLGAALIIVGAIVFLAGSAALGFKYIKLDTHKYQNATYAPEGEFSRIDVDDDTADVGFLRAENGKLRVECFEIADEPHEVSIENGTLYIKAAERNWLSNLSFRLKTTTVRIYLPNDVYESVSVDTDTGDTAFENGFSLGTLQIDGSTGDVTVSGAKIGNARVHVSTGDVEFADSEVGALNVISSTGDITLENIAGVSGGVALTASTGDIKLSRIQADACAISIKTDTGSVSFKDTSCAGISVETDTGDVTFDSVAVRGRLETETDTGDIKLVRADTDELRFKTDTGDVEGSVIGEKIYITNTHTGHVSVPQTYSGGKCEIETDTGDIKIEMLSAD